MGFSFVNRRQSLPAMDVLGRRDRFQMLGIFAGAIAAKVIDLQAGRNWAVCFLISNAMRQTQFATNPHLPITVRC